MPVSLYDVSAPVFIQGLRGLHGILEKAKAHVAAKGVDPAALLTARLYPDMFAFTKQVQIVTDFAKGPVGRLAGAEFPVFEDAETSFDELQDRIERTIAYIEGFSAADIDGHEDRDITLTRRGVDTVIKAKPYLLQQALPNFFFHLTTAYAILRHNGVEIGKKDFLGTA